MVAVKELQDYCDAVLQPGAVKDYCHNGLQISGKATVSTIISGVSLNQALIEQAIAHSADAVLVHHGIFWHKGPSTLTGVMRDRVALLLAHNINLLAYHLPLDIHAEYGNNHLLGRHMGWHIERTFPLFGIQDLGVIGTLPQPVTVDALTTQCAEGLQQAPIVIQAPSNRPIQHIAWCTGAAEDGIEIAKETGADAYISGEIAERTPALAQELDIHYLAVGHHASERFGVAAFGAKLATEFTIHHQFIDITNPV